MLKLILPLAFLASILAVAPAIAQSPPAGFENHRFNGPIDPVTAADGVTSFHIESEGCSSVDYGDGRGESDCINGNIRSMFGHFPRAELGQVLDYSFDVRIDPSLEYESYFNPASAGFEPGALDSNIRIATWEGTFLHNFIYILKASKTAGLTFAGEQCQAPEDFGQWVSFSLKVKWTGDNKGWIAVTCDDRYVYVAEDIATNVAPDCYVQNQCVPGEERNPDKVLFIAGLQMAGWGHTWEEIGKDSAFIPIQDGGITVQMRNMSVTPGPVLYGPDEKALATKLQETLNALGCDVGAADGAPGRRTKEAALTCRQFEPGAMPSALNVATLQTFYDLYTAEGVADLPPGSLPVTPIGIHAWQQGSETSGADPRVVADFEGRVTGDPTGVEDLSFLLTGEVDPAGGRFNWFGLLMLDDLGGNVAADACDGVRIENWDDGTSHAVIEFDDRELRYVALDFDCALKKLPPDIAREAAFIVGHFADLAAGMIEDGTIVGVSNDGLVDFLRRAAAGEIIVERAALVDGLLTPTYVLDIFADDIQIQDDQLLLALHAEPEGLGLGFDEIDVLVIGKYSPPLENLYELSLILEKGAPPTVAEPLSKCRDVRTEDWGDGKLRVVFMFDMNGKGNFIAKGAECGIAALDGQLAKEAEFLLTHFSDIAVSLVANGRNQAIADEGMPIFIEKVAKGEVVVSR